MATMRALLKRNEIRRLRARLTGPAGSVDEVHEGSLGLLPATGLETAVLEAKSVIT